jgi:molybdate-binding protein/DNA-binding transcriptional regulator YhcF (GntR family)
MDESYLYQQIAESIRRKIIAGEYKPGDRLPPIRSMVKEWHCTPGTVQRAYHELTSQGLLFSHPGKGTFVLDSIQLPRDAHMRMASLVHRAESFLLEVLTSGYSPEDVTRAVSLAIDRWQSLDSSVRPTVIDKLEFSGSHDLAVKWLSEHFAELNQGMVFNTEFTGSLGGLLSLAQGNTNIAGSHLWDPDTDTYNDAFIRKIFAGKKMSAITLAHRNLGLMVLPGNPVHITKIAQLAKPGVRFVNRQSGSGTRVWFDLQLKMAGLSNRQIKGYDNIKVTHSQVAQAIIDGQADAGIGLEAVSRAFSLDFIPLTQERYDLVTYAENLKQAPFIKLQKNLGDKEILKSISRLGGYDCKESGQVRFIN